MQNGQAFVLHIWDDQDCKIDVESDDWSPGFELINYITHFAGVCKRGLLAKTEFVNYILSF